MSILNSISETLFLVRPEIQTAVSQEIKRQETQLWENPPKTFEALSEYSSAENAYLKGLHLFRTKEYTESIGWLSQSSCDPKLKIPSFQILAHAHFSNQDYRLSLFYLKALLFVASSQSEIFLAKAIVYTKLGNFEQALHFLENEAQPHRETSLFKYTLQHVLFELKHYLAAASLLKNSVMLWPDQMHLYKMWGVCLLESGYAHQIPAYCAKVLGNHPESEKWLQSLSPKTQEWLPQTHPYYHAFLLRSLQFNNAVSDTELQAQSKIWPAIHLKKTLSKSDKEVTPPLHLGYLCQNPSGREWIYHHSEAFKVTLFADSWKKIKLQAPKADLSLVKTAHLNSEGFCEEVKRQEIDILIDLEGYRSPHRLFALSQKPAPYQVSFSDLCSTPGFDLSMNEKIKNQELAPFYWNKPQQTDSLKRLSAPHFGSNAQLKYITPDTLKLWGLLLKNIPHASLYYALTDTVSKQNQTEILTHWQSYGLPPERIIFCQEEDAFYEAFDIYLDTTPMSDTEAFCHALWHGKKPLVYQSSENNRSKGAQILSYLNIKGRAETQGEYIAVAQNWLNTTTPTELENIQYLLTESAITNPQKYSYALEALYQNMINS